jgi:hypothetical protein
VVASKLLLISGFKRQDAANGEQFNPEGAEERLYQHHLFVVSRIQAST